VLGVDPDLIVLTNGVIACSYGVKSRMEGMRRERNVIFSLDSGVTWTHTTLIYGGPGGSYPALSEIRPGEILYVYEAQALSEAANQRNPGRFHALGTMIRVKKM
jgi:hypothetical protein